MSKSNDMDVNDACDSERHLKTQSVLHYRFTAEIQRESSIVLSFCWKQSQLKRNYFYFPFARGKKSKSLNPFSSYIIIYNLKFSIDKRISLIILCFITCDDLLFHFIK